MNEISNEIQIIGYNPFIVTGVVLELTNDSQFYDKFTKDLALCLRDKRNWSDSREVLKGHIFRTSFSSTSESNTAIILALISHYSEEVYGVHVPTDKVKKFIDDGHKSETGKYEPKVGDLFEVIKTGGHPDNQILGAILKLTELRYYEIGKNCCHYYENEEGERIAVLDDRVKPYTPVPVTPSAPLPAPPEPYTDSYSESADTSFKAGDTVLIVKKARGDWVSSMDKFVGTVQTIDRMSGSGRAYTCGWHFKIESLKKVQPEPVPEPCAPWFDDQVHPPVQEPVQEPPQEPQETKAQVTIETVRLINSIDAKHYTDDQIFDIIASVESKIKVLDKIQNKPKKLNALIAAMQLNIEELVEIVDAR